MCSPGRAGRRRPIGSAASTAAPSNGGAHTAVTSPHRSNGRSGSVTRGAREAITTGQRHRCVRYARVHDTAEAKERLAAGGAGFLPAGASEEGQRFHICGRLPERKKNLRDCIARSQVLTSVRPVLRPFSCRGPVWEFADRVQITPTRSRRRVKNWLPDPVSH